jgi:DNA-binding SARP family transcriptional activator
MTIMAAGTVVAAGERQAALSLLQGFELQVGSRVLPLSPASQRLVAFLALHERPVHRRYVGGTLWPDVREERARANLRSALWRVPDVGGEPLITASPTHLRLWPGLSVDFRHALTRSEHLLRAASPGALGEGLDVFCYDLLPDWYEDWVILERERYRQLRLRTLDRICQRLIDEGIYTDALQLVLRAVAAEPLRESAYRNLVRIHLAEGNFAEAVRVYQRYARMLHAELGARPSAAMHALFDGKVSLLPVGEKDSAQAGQRASTRLRQSRAQTPGHRPAPSAAIPDPKLSSG